MYYANPFFYILFSRAFVCAFLSKLSLSALFKSIDKHAVGFSLSLSVPLSFFFCCSHRMYSIVYKLALSFWSCYRNMVECILCWSHILHGQITRSKWRAILQCIRAFNCYEIFACCFLIFVDKMQLVCKSYMVCLFTNEHNETNYVEWNEIYTSWFFSMKLLFTPTLHAIRHVFEQNILKLFFFYDLFEIEKFRQLINWT